MAGKRAATEKFIIDNVESLLPGGGNAEIYKGLFKSMNDEQCDKFMENLADGSVKLSIIAPNLSSKKLTMENNYAVADRLGHNFFERVWMDGKNGAPRYLSKEPYMIIDLPMRRQAQLLIKKIVEWSHISRKQGLLGLEQQLEKERDGFVRKGLQLVIDGGEPDEIRNSLEVELDTREAADTRAAKVS